MKLATNGIELYYEKLGQGAPMLLLHGNGQDRQIFSQLGKKLQQDFTLYLIDSRNHGQSSKTDVYSYATMAQDLYSFITDLGLGKVNLLGFSDGAITSLCLALQHSEVIDKMALLGVNLKPTDFNERSFSYIKAKYEETKDPLFRLMLEQPQIELADVQNVHIPTLLIAAEKELYRPELYPELAQAMPEARLKIMPGHKHETYLVGQDLLYPDLINFFEEKD